MLNASEKLGKSIDSKEDGGRTLVMRACEYSNCDALKMIINRGANLEEKFDPTGMTALLMCDWTIESKDGRLKCAQLLMESGANVEAADKNGQTALCLAAIDGDADLLSLLIKHKANVNARNHRQSSVLLMASARGHSDCVRLLLAVENIEVDAMNDNGDTALLCAARRGHTHVLSLLIEHKANVNVVGRLGPSAREGMVCFEICHFLDQEAGC
jgi:ankyrin repeat protein